MNFGEVVVDSRTKRMNEGVMGPVITVTQALLASSCPKKECTPYKLYTPSGKRRTKNKVRKGKIMSVSLDS